MGTQTAVTTPQSLVRLGGRETDWCTGVFLHCLPTPEHPPTIPRPHHEAHGQTLVEAEDGVSCTEVAHGLVGWPLGLSPTPPPFPLQPKTLPAGS